MSVSEPITSFSSLLGSWLYDFTSFVGNIMNGWVIMLSLLLLSFIIYLFYKIITNYIEVIAVKER